MVMISISSYSTILVVDNNTDAPASFKTINSALSTASDGDTIYLQPSSKSYGDFSFDKKLIIIGGGAYPIKQNNTPTKAGKITLNKGTSRSIIMGLYIEGGIRAGADSLINILIANCYIMYGISAGKGINAWIIEGCAFHEYGTSIVIESCNNVLFQNNIFGGAVGGGNSGDILFNSALVSNVIFKNNIWSSRGGSKVINSYNNLSSLVFENNIFYGNNFDFSTLTGCQWYNNCFYLTNNFIGNTGGNSGNFQANPLFVNFPASGETFYFTHDYHLSSGSPCIGTGLGGTDIGVYGGAKRFNPGLLPPVPQIMQINLKNSTVPNGGTLKFEVIIEQSK